MLEWYISLSTLFPPSRFLSLSLSLSLSLTLITILLSCHYTLVLFRVSKVIARLISSYFCVFERCKRKLVHIHFLMLASSFSLQTVWLSLNPADNIIVWRVEESVQCHKIGWMGLHSAGAPRRRPTPCWSSRINYPAVSSMIVWFTGYP